MPPYEINGKQVEMLNNSNGQLINIQSYLQSRQSAALAGQVYEPTIGFADIRNVPNAPKVSVQSVLRRLQPARFAGVEPEIRERLAQQGVRGRQDCNSRRLCSNLRPS